MKNIHLLVILVSLASSAAAQLPQTDSLFIALDKQDSIFFERSFNRCDIPYLDSSIHPDLIFFHDQGGMQDRTKFFASVKKNLCGNAASKPIRKRVAGSLQLYPLYSDGKLYGVIQMGIHEFYLRQPNKPDVRTSIAKFTHVWLLLNNRWIIKEVLSYDHQPG